MGVAANVAVLVGTSAFVGAMVGTLVVVGVVRPVDTATACACAVFVGMTETVGDRAQPASEHTTSSEVKAKRAFMMGSQCSL